jgi:hypothetical protein
MDMTAGRVHFLSWCPLDLLRPRAIQVGRAAQAMARTGWEVHLICASLDLEVEDDLVDADLAGLHAPAFASINAVPDTAFGRAPEEDQDTDTGKGRSVFRRRRPPTPREPWEVASAKTVISRLRRESHPLLMSFGQPWSSHRAALTVKQALPRVCWIAHFSDPWADNPYHRFSDVNVEDLRAEERRVVEAADALVFVTRQTADLVMSHYPTDLGGKVAVIPHLLDRELAARIAPAPRTDTRLRFLHAGSLYGGRRAPSGLLGALARLSGSGVTPDDLEVRFVGDMPPSVRADIQEAGLEGFIRSTSPLYYLPSLREMAAADAVLVIDADFENSPFLPSKVIDYLMLDRPIAALTPAGSPSDDLMRRLGYPVAAPSDPEGCASLIQGLLARHKLGTLDISAAHRSVMGDFGLETGGRSYNDLIWRTRQRKTPS